jgi:CRISPR/Cas system-associated exonuclease Cas4 (RecB family)
MNINATFINYLHICHRKLWLHANVIRMASDIYLYLLRKNEIVANYGTIEYPKLRQTDKVELKEDDVTVLYNVFGSNLLHTHAKSTFLIVP